MWSARSKFPIAFMTFKRHRAAQTYVCTRFGSLGTTQTGVDVDKMATRMVIMAII